MKLAITTQGPEADSPVDLRFGRARYFRVVDLDTGQQTAVDNTEGANAAQGAGIHASQTLAKLGVQTVITGHVGPKAWSVLQAAGIQVYAVKEGTAAEAAQAFLAGQLQPLSQPDVRGHWA